LWANACCGHPRPGEDLAAAAERRLDEEMGITCPLTWRAKTHYQCALEGGMHENEIVHLFFGEYDGAIRPDPQEVMDWKWVDLESFRREAAGSPEVVYWVQDYLRKGLL
jgi:isopentenyl-diphosphate delta-isomerase